jgi:hypothetical protein
VSEPVAHPLGVPSRGEGRLVGQRYGLVGQCIRAVLRGRPRLLTERRSALRPSLRRVRLPSARGGPTVLLARQEREVGRCRCAGGGVGGPVRPSPRPGEATRRFGAGCPARSDPPETPTTPRDTAVRTAESQKGADGGEMAPSAHVPNGGSLALMGSREPTSAYERGYSSFGGRRRYSWGRGLLTPHATAAAPAGTTCPRAFRLREESRLVNGSVPAMTAGAFRWGCEQAGFAGKSGGVVCVRPDAVRTGPKVAAWERGSDGCPAQQPPRVG